jgi:uncharacterized protein (DUF1501 family)
MSCTRDDRYTRRREFLKQFGAALALPFSVGGIPFTAYGNTPLLAALSSAAGALDRVLVLVQLSGGNDGLNTVIPLDQYATYAGLRKKHCHTGSECAASERRHRASSRDDGDEGFVQ